MSTFYHIYAVIPETPTKEMVTKILTNVDQLKPLQMYHNFYASTALIESRLESVDEGINVAWQELLSRNNSEFIYSFDCLDEECDMYSQYKVMGLKHTEPAYVSFWRTARGTMVDFSPKGLVPYRNTFGGVEVYYDWYLSKLLKITEPYPIGELVVCNDFFWNEHDLDGKVTEWKVTVDPALLCWRDRSMHAASRESDDLEKIEKYLLKLKAKCDSKGYELMGFNVPSLLKIDLPYVFPIKAEWGVAKLIIGKTLSIAPLKEGEKPVDLRPYIKTVFDLIEGEKIYYFEAFNSVDYHRVKEV